MNKKKLKPLLIVISGPSGVGKTTLGKMLLKGFPNMQRSVSGTTRSKRPGEVHGRDYYFLAPALFERKLRGGYFLETAFVHGHRYGTPKETVLATLRKGHDVLLVIDVQGAKQVRACTARGRNKELKAALVDVFILPPDMDELKKRIAKRGQDCINDVRVRLKNALREMRAWRAFKYLVVNDKLGEAYEELRAIVIAEHCRNAINLNSAEDI